MSSMLPQRSISKRSLTFNKSFFISLFIHLVLVFGVSITTYYKLPILNNSPIINVKFANSNEDYITNIAKENIKNIENLKKEISFNESGNIQSPNTSLQSFKIKKLKANSITNSEEAIYLNLWQRKIETIGEEIILDRKSDINGTVQIMARIDMYGNLINSEILISSGSKFIDDMAINILKQSAPFPPFNLNMSNEYNVLEIVRDWNFSSS
jgi:Periplasmic protein TonB, links inner and outer membranes